jgi:hypothetical protein
LVIAVYGILVDCTFDVNVQLGGGLVVYNGGYDVFFDCTVDQNVVYIETYTNGTYNVTYHLY